MTSKVDFRRLSVRDIGLMEDLHREYFGYRTAECLKWQFFDRDLPAESIVIGVFDGSKLIGTQAFIPVKAHWNGREILASQSELTLLLPEYRGHQIFQEMYNTGIEMCEREGISCIFGITKAIKAFRSVGFQILGNWHLDLLVLNPVKFLAALLNRSRGWTLPPEAPLSMVPGQMNDSEDGTFGLRRNDQYIRHWYTNNPYRIIVHFDEENGILYTAGRNRPFVLLSEITKLDSLQSSVRRAVNGRRWEWVSLCRKTNHPAFGMFSVPGAIHVVLRDRGSLIFRWIGSFRERNVPSIFMEEGFGEGTL